MQAFYVTIDKPNLRYSNVEGGIGDTWVKSQESEIVVKVGAGLGGRLASFSSIFEPRVMNGVIHFHLRNSESIPPPPAIPILPLSPTSIRGSLKTEKLFDTSSYGVIFSVRNKGVLTIHVTGFSIYSDFIGDFGVEIYELEGDSARELEAARLPIASATISGFGLNNLIPIPLQAYIKLDAGQQQTIYLTLDRPSLQYAMADESAVSVTDEHIEILDGSGVLGYPLSTFNTRSGRRFVGAVDYRAGEGGISTVSSTPQTSIETDVIASKSLTTSFEGKSGSYGALFDVTNVRESEKVKITKLDVHVSGTNVLRCEVWSRRGSSLDYPWNTNGGGWINAANENLLPGAESGKPVLARFSEGSFAPIEINPGGLVGLLIQCEEERTRYSVFESNGSDKIVAKNDSIMIESGYGVTLYPLSARVAFDRAFEGVIHYDVINM